jgi:hypothetical protein
MKNIVEKEKYHRLFIINENKLKKDELKYQQLKISLNGYNSSTNDIDYGKKIWLNRFEFIRVLCTDGCLTLNSLTLGLNGHSARQVENISRDSQKLINDIKIITKNNDYYQSNSSFHSMLWSTRQQNTKL